MSYFIALIGGFVCGAALGYYILRERVKDKQEQKKYHCGE